MEKICKSHKFPKAYLCTSPSCSKEANVCLLCVKEHHVDCENKFFVEAGKIKQKVSFKNLEENCEELSAKFAAFFDEQIELFRSAILDLKKQYLLEIQKDFSYEVNDRFWDHFKNSFVVSFDDSSSMIDVKSKPENIDELKKLLVTRLEDRFDPINKKIVTKINQFKTENLGYMRASEWKGDDSIIASDTERGVTFNRERNLRAKKFQIKYLDLPKSDLKFIFTIKDHDSRRIEMSFGIVNRDLIEKLSDSGDIDYSKYFCYHCIKNCDYYDSSKKKNSKKSSDFCREFYVEYARGEPIRFYSGGQQFDWSPKKLFDESEVYSFFILFKKKKILWASV